MTGDQSTAEDVVQDAFLGLHRRWRWLHDSDKGKPASTPAGNLFGVVANGHFTPLPTLVTGTGYASGAANGEGGTAF